MYLPLMYNVMDKKTLIIGGGSVGFRRASKLLEYGTQLKVVSLSFLEGFYQFENIELIHGSYEKNYIYGAHLVIAATSDKAVNAQIYRDCQIEKILCNIVDDPERSDVIFPASVRNSGITFSVSTEGSSPILAKQILQTFTDLYEDSFEERVKLLGVIRKQIINSEAIAEEKQKLLEEILQWPVETLKDYINKNRM